VNLPYRFSLWRSADYLHVRDLDDRWSDQEIWRHAEYHGMTIVTKDSDFANWIMLQQPPPRVIHIRIGNCRLRDLYLHLQSVWPRVCTLSEQHKLINVHRDRIEGVR